MKLKTVFAASLLVGGVAFADSTEVTTEYTIGVLPLNITTTNTIIAIPWVAAGATTNGVAVANLIKTAGLTARDGDDMGDMLYWYDTSRGKYAAWYIDNNEWTPLDVDGDDAPVLQNDTVLLRGQAALLKLTTTPKTVYVIGQYFNGDTDTITIAKGTSAAPKATLIAPPRTSDVTLNDNCTWDYVGSNDWIVVSAGDGGSVKTFIYDTEKEKWGVETSSLADGVRFDTTATIPAGCGAFYMSRTDGGEAPTVRWTAL